MKKNRSKALNNQSDCRKRPGVVLLVTLVLLVVLSTLGYTLTNRVAAQRHRNQYIIDYQAARYGCDSAVKYALAVLEDINSPKLISRPDEPDFSDLFWRSEQQYREYLAEWVGENAFDRDNRFDDINDVGGVGDSNDPNFLTVRGPYGPPWPFITEPIEFEIGSATVRIVIEDENAKYPLGWAMLNEAKLRREALAGLKTFCEWMDVNSVQVDSLKTQLDEIGKIKSFEVDFKPIKIMERRARSRRSRRGRRRRTRRARTVRKIPAVVHIKDFAKLFHSSLIDTEALARPTIIGENRKESLLKYMGLWGSGKVNINTAPRHVLEAAFTFGGDADSIAEEIIQRRRIKPFEDIEDLRQSLFKYSDSIKKCEKYITTRSKFFTIRVTAVSRVAQVSTFVAITKDGKKIEKIAVISG